MSISAKNLWSLIALGLVAGGARAALPTSNLVTAPPVPTSVLSGYASTRTEGVAAWQQTPPELAALARTLGADRVLATPQRMTPQAYAQNVFDYVRNNIDLELRFGLAKGGRGALIDQSGTPFDQAELMYKLLRLANISASYKLGTVTLNADQFARMTGSFTALTPAVAVDARAACQLLADGGIPTDIGTSCGSLTGSASSIKFAHIWIAALGNLYDPAMKSHVLKATVDIPQAMGCGNFAASTCGADLVAAAAPAVGSVPGFTALKNFNEGAVTGWLSARAVSVQAAVQAIDRNAVAQDFVGGRRLANTSVTAGTTLPYTNAEVTSWSGDIPNSFRTTLRVRYRSESLLAPYGVGADQQFFADELGGRVLQLSADEKFWLDANTQINPQSTCPGCPAGSVVLLDINHPYAAAAGAFADESLQIQTWIAEAYSVGGNLPVRGIFPYTIVLGLGNASPSTEKHISGMLERGPQGWPEAYEINVPSQGRIDTTVDARDQPLLGAKLLNEGAAADRLIAGIASAAITRHHDLGLIYGHGYSPGSISQMSVQSAVSVNTNSSATSATELRLPAYEASAATWAMLEGSVNQQANNTNGGFSTATSFRSANFAGDSFFEMTPAQLAAGSFPSTIWNVSTYRDRLRAAGVEGYSTILTHRGGVELMTKANSSAHTLYAVAKGGSDPNSDPISKALETTKLVDAAAARKKSWSVSPADGSGTLVQTDLVTGVGDFPTSLPFTRTYQTSQAVRDDYIYNNSQTWIYTPDSQSFSSSWNKRYDGPDSGANTRIGAGWNHNYNVTASIFGNGSKALGADSAIEAARAIAVLWAFMDANRWSRLDLPNRNLRTRVTTMIAESWLANSLAFNAATVAKGSSSESFQRLADGSFYNARNDSRLVQSGTQTIENDFSPVTLQYTGKDGDQITFAVGKYSKFPAPGSNNAPLKAEPMFVATGWTFPDGTVVTFTYTPEWLVESGPDPVVHPISCVPFEPCNMPPIPNTLARGLVLRSVSNNFGRTLTFDSVSTTAKVPQLGQGGWPVYTDFTSTFRLRRVTDENGRFVDFALSDCPATSSATLVCNTFTASSPTDANTPAAYNRFTYQAGGDSPDPALTLRGNYRLRRWMTPSNQGTAYRTFGYDALYHITRVTDMRGNSTYYYPGSIVGTERWKRAEVVSGVGAVRVSILDEKNSVLRAIDPLGNVTNNTYDVVGRQLTSTGPEGDVVTNDYDVRSNLLSSTRKAKPGSTLADIVTSTTYGEGRNQLVCSNQKTCNKPATTTDPRGTVTRNTWDPDNGTLTRIETGLNSSLSCSSNIGTVCPQTDLLYLPAQTNGVVMLRQITKRVTPSTNLLSTFGYEENNHWVLKTGIADSGSGRPNLTTTLGFDNVGNLTQVDGPRTDVTDVRNFTWDARRRLRLAIEPDPDGGGALPRVAVRTSYDVDDLVTMSEKGTTTNAQGSDFVAAETTTNGYDPVGNRTRVTTPAGVTQMSYDQDDQLLCTAVRMNPAVYGSLPVDDPSTSALTDDGACMPATAGAYGRDRITRRVYDLAGQVLKEQRAYATPLQQDYFTAAYTPSGKQDWVEDANGNRSDFVYDGFDRLCRLYFPQTTSGAHAANTGQPANTVLSCSSPNTGDYEQYGYDANGNRNSFRKRGSGTAADRTILYSYDALNRETRKNLPLDDTLDVNTRYDLASRKLFMHFGASAGSASSNCTATAAGIDYCYDRLGRVTRENAFGRPLDYQYNNAGARKRVTWPGTTQFIEYTYDAADRMKLVCENSDGCTTGVLATYSYDNLGRRGTITRQNNVTTTFGYDGASRLKSVGQDVAGTTQDVNFLLNSYNPASQVMQRTRDNGLYVYGLPIATRSYVPDGLNRYGSVGGTTMSYDPRGNLTGDGTRTFTYDLENHLTNVTGPATMKLDYDPMGRLNQTTVGVSPSTVITTFLYDGDKLTAEYSGTGTSATVLRRYVHGAGVDEPLLWYEGSGFTDKRWYLTDHQGSVIATTNTSGAATPYAYGPYGEPKNDDWSGSRFRYTGQIALNDAAGLRLYHYKARVYDPYLGRFLQTDPIGYKDDNNLYAYTGNDPLNRSDPTGLATTCDSATGWCKMTTDNRSMYRATNRDVKLTQEQKQAVQAAVSSYRVRGGSREKLGFVVRGSDGKLSNQMAGNATHATTNTGTTAGAGVPTNAEVVMHGHINGGDKASNGAVDNPADANGYGDTMSLSLKTPMPTVTVSHGKWSVHEMENGGLTYSFQQGSMSKSQQDAMQKNLNSEQTKFEVSDEDKVAM